MFDLSPDSGGGNEDNPDLFKKCGALLHSVPTHASAGDSWTLTGKLVSLLWGHCSFLLGPSGHKVLFAPSKSLFPQSCVSSGGSMVGLMVTSSKRAYATPRSMLKEISLEYSLEGLMLKLKLKLWPPNAKN